MENLKIYFTSDVHGYVFPTDYRDTDHKEQGFLSMMKGFKKDGNTLIIDGGDTIQGSPFVSYINNQGFDIHPLSKVMNAAGYDYVVLGNHDFNYGYNYLKSYIDNLDAKCLCANVKDISGGIDILPYDIRKMDNGIVVGIIGITTDFIPVWEKKENIKNFEVFNTIDSIKNFYKGLKSEVDILIGVYHGGFEYDLRSHKKLRDTTENVAYGLCQQFDFDLLLTGHQHMEIQGEYISGTYIVQTPENGRKYIELDISIQDKKIQHISSSIKKPDHSPYGETYDQLTEIESSVQGWLDRPVGFLDTPLHPKSHIEMALKGSYLANFINQIQLEVSGADISCTSFANSVKGFDSEVSIRDIVSTYIYPNTLVILEVTGDQLLMALERSASYFNNINGHISVSESFLKPKVEHYNYDYFSNINYQFDLSKDIGNRVIKAQHKGQDIDRIKTYTLVMNNYRASGAGGYEFYSEAKKVREIQVEMPELIIAYFERYTNVTVDKTKYIESPIV